MVAKQDTEEIYALIRRALSIGAPVIAIVALLGAAAMYSQLNPLVRRMRAIEDELSHLAQHDSLTGLPNRLLFTDRLATALERAARSRRAVALMFLDLDGFKGINDRHGHKAGDELLKQTAFRLANAVRKSDTVARLGGDEFTIVLEDPKRPRADAERVAAKIVEAMRVPFAIAGVELHVSVSVGLVVHQAGDGHIEVTEMLRLADDAMYAVKRAGKNAFGSAVQGKKQTAVIV